MNTSLQDLFVIEMASLYDAETQLVKALRKMSRNAASPDLRAAFKEHLQKTKEHASRIERIFGDLQLSDKLKSEKCKGMQGLISEANNLLKRNLPPAVEDAGIISSAQHVEHYEIAAYGCVRTYAELLRHKSAVDLLEQTLQEEKDADEKLTGLAQQINMDAAQMLAEPGTGESGDGSEARAKATS